ncbi:MAG: hypothetical protein ACRDF9_01715 [Candidatus Limnocylindria bacterium]
MIARSLVVIAFVIAGLLLSARPSLACTCPSYTPSELATVSEVVFTGLARAYGEERLLSTAVEFQVVTVYKGAVAPRMRVQALGARGLSELGPGCGWGFRLGRHYTVFAVDHDSDGVPNTNGCLYNVEGPISAAAYGLPSGRAPAGDGEVVALLIVAALAVLALASISMLRRPRPLAS